MWAREDWGCVLKIHLPSTQFLRFNLLPRHWCRMNGIESVQNSRINIHSTAAIWVMKDHFFLHDGRFGEGWADAEAASPLSSISRISHYFLSVAHPHNAPTNMCCLLSGCRGVKRLWGVFFILYRGQGRTFYYTCLSPCPLFISPQLSLAPFSSLFSYLTEGCRILQSGWWSSNSIYPAAQRQTERARAIGSGMETTDVREHFLLAAARRGRPYRKLAWRCDARVDPAGGCVCLGVCRRGHYLPKTMSLSKDWFWQEKSKTSLCSFLFLSPLLTQPSAETEHDWQLKLKALRWSQLERRLCSYTGNEHQRISIEWNLV